MQWRSPASLSSAQSHLPGAAMPVLLIWGWLFLPHQRFCPAPQGECRSFSPAPCSRHGWCWVNVDVGSRLKLDCAKPHAGGTWFFQQRCQLCGPRTGFECWDMNTLSLISNVCSCVFWSRERVNGFQILKRVYDLENLKTIQVSNWQSGLCGDGLGLRLHIISLETRC